MCTDAETGWILFATGASMAVFAVVWTLGTWVVEGRIAAAKEKRASERWRHSSPGNGQHSGHEVR